MKNKNVIPFKDPDKKADGGRAGFDMGGAPSIILNPEEREAGKVFETDKVEEAIKEIIKRAIVSWKFLP